MRFVPQKLALRRKVAISASGSILPMMSDIESSFREYREPVRELCGKFDSRYWQDVEATSGYPEEFVKALTDAGWLAALIPPEFGGGGLAITEGAASLRAAEPSAG